ncbi:MAG: HD domain-containing protein [Coriobacteriia bacterium]|nr:HD domain-containing protein [Coriobacteriia bacterium]
MIAIDPPSVPASWFDRPDGSCGANGIHGIAHTQRVWIHAQEIAELLGLAEWQRQALNHAALWHDIGRTHDGGDYYHGAKSAGKAVGLGLHEGIDPAVRDTALYAITHHCGREEHGERAAEWLADREAALAVFRVLKDADGLDRVRLGRHELDVGQLRFEVSRQRVERAWELLEQVR